MNCLHPNVSLSDFIAQCPNCGQKAKIGKFKLIPAFGHVRVKGAMEYLKKIVRIKRERS